MAHWGKILLMLQFWFAMSFAENKETPSYISDGTTFPSLIPESDSQDDSTLSSLIPESDSQDDSYDFSTQVYEWYPEATTDKSGTIH
ncbi:Uncharacterized protein BM_BM231 [Brugia malayi]|uniref:Bm231 n=1 Tax=Brugia malayi TaxID=6279 RepID=A0A4E9FDS0_BRUMA|nr:Uncharacterized protein BM_BM231 [Brugia malayi]XP_042935416.1 Uncharacterized protein BM_BM231 [Brugia malayi]VIO95051.1 Uncharacterized protein BM_BM231 [Brugia malayi]VIO95052.1 Uncharacterized protein BM_BM231 [Brugia malayi]